MGDAAAAIADCDAAIARGREVRAEFKLVAKAMARKATALSKGGDLEGAITWYNKVRGRARALLSCR